MVTHNSKIDLPLDLTRLPLFSFKSIFLSFCDKEQGRRHFKHIFLSLFPSLGQLLMSKYLVLRQAAAADAFQQSTSDFRQKVFSQSFGAFFRDLFLLMTYA